MSERPPNFDADVIAQFRANQGQLTSGPFAGRTLLLLTTTGARTGRPLTKPLGFTRDGERYVVIASKGGAPTHPAWYHNLRANPQGYVTVDGRRSAFRASEARGDVRDRIWREGLEVYPGWSQYERRAAHREIAVFVLETASAPASDAG